MTGRSSVVDEARLGELVARRDPPILVIDPEDRHRACSLGGSPRSAAWERWLVARSAAPKTRRAYLADVTQLAEWAGAHDLAPEDLDHKRLRLFAGVLSERGASKSTVARKLASARSFYRHLVDRGELEASPADLVDAPKRDQYLPRVLKADEVAALLDSIPASTPLELRDRAIFELAYATGLRAEELTTARHGRRRLRRRGAARAREGRQGARRPGRRAGLARARTLTSSAAARCSHARATRANAPSSSRRAAAGSAHPICGAGCAPGRGARAPRRGRRRTRSGTRLRPICWREGPICARSRSSSATRPSARPRHTLG